MDVRRAAGNCGRVGGEAAGGGTSGEVPIHGSSRKGIGYLFFSGEDNERRLQQAGSNHRRRVRLGHSDGAWCVGLERVGVRGSVARYRGRGPRESGGDDDGDEWFHGTGLSGLNWLHSLSLGKPCNALGEAVLFDELRPAYPILRLGGESSVAALIKVQGDNLRDPVAPNVQRFAVLQALEECDLLFVHLEQLGISFTVERRVLQEEEGRAGVHDAVGVRTQIVGGLANHGYATKVLPNGLDRSERTV